MHLLLTDRLTCPRCGPDFGLVLLADEMDDRRVRDGTLGCPNCRDAFPIRDGFADVRAPPRGELPAGRATIPADGSEEEAVRLQALLDIRRGPGTVVLVGGPAGLASLLADSVDELQVVAVDPAARMWRDHPGVSRMTGFPGLPFFSRTMRGAVVDGAMGGDVVREGARVVAPGARVVVVNAPSDAEEILADGGLSVLVAESETVVATRG